MNFWNTQLTVSEQCLMECSEGEWARFWSPCLCAKFCDRPTGIHGHQKLGIHVDPSQIFVVRAVYSSGYLIKWRRITSGVLAWVRMSMARDFKMPPWNKKEHAATQASCSALTNSGWVFFCRAISFLRWSGSWSVPNDFTNLETITAPHLLFCLFWSLHFLPEDNFFPKVQNALSFATCQGEIYFVIDLAEWKQHNGIALPFAMYLMSALVSI